MMTRIAENRKQTRAAVKTPEGAFLHVLQEEFEFSQRLSGEVLQAAQEILIGSGNGPRIRPGQIVLMVASEKAPFGPRLEETAQVEVTLTIDAGGEDAEVRERDGLEGLRRSRIVRVIDEVLEQGGVLTQEDLARGLGVNERTIRRDIRELKSEGFLIHTRGQLKGVGRGQTHKIKIIELWLDRMGYEQIGRKMHHSGQAIKRYVSTFLRMVILHRAGRPIEETAFITQSSQKLVQDYLAIYEATKALPQRHEKLEEEISRVQGASGAEAMQVSAKMAGKEGQKGGRRAQA